VAVRELPALRRRRPVADGRRPAPVRVLLGVPRHGAAGEGPVTVALVVLGLLSFVYGGAWAAGAAAVLMYALTCWLWPFSACLRCHGDKRTRSPSGRSWRRCRRCKGTGQRLRVGRRVMNAMSTAHEKGK